MHDPSADPSADAPIAATTSGAEVRLVFVAAARHAAALLAAPAISDGWARPSALEAWTVGGLAGHLARAVLTTAGYLADPPPPPTAPLVDAVTYFAEALPAADLDVGSAVAASIRARGDAEATAGHAALAARSASAVDALEEALRSTPDGRVLAVLGGRAITLEEYLRTRIVEVAVHADDLAASVEGELPPTPPIVLRAATDVLVDLARRRHGETGLLRGLARRERHPGPLAF